MPVLTDAPIADLHAFLRKEGALVVHFSSSPKLPGNINVLYPEDLRYAFANRGTCTPCCSTVKPSDHSIGNATGSVGLILRLKSEASVMSVYKDDDGTNLKRFDRKVTLAECRDSLASRTAYTEWVVRDYDVIGVLAVEPMEVEGAEPLDCPGSEDVPVELLDGPGRQAVGLTFARIAEDFPDLPLYTFHNGHLHLWQRREVSFDEIYTV